MNNSPLLGRLSELYEQAPSGFVVTLWNGTIVHANTTFAQWLGYTPGTMDEGDLRFQDLLTLPAKLFYENQFAPLLAIQEHVQEVALDLSAADGSVLPCLVNAVRLPRNADGAMLDAYSVFHATERRRYETELLVMRRRAEELASVVNAVQDAILSISPSGHVQTYNDGARHLFGAYRGELNGRLLADILRWADHDAGVDEIWSRLEAGRAIHRDAIAVTVQSQEINVAASLSPYISERGALISVACVLSDIRERKHLEQMQRDFLATASHELRNPLTVLKGQLQLMRRRDQLDTESFQALSDQVNQLVQLVEELHLANEMELQHIGLRRENLDLIAEVSHLRGVVLDTHPVSVETNLPSLYVSADSTRLRQVITNLLSNAAKYSPAGSEIDIAVTQEDSFALLRVTDHGPGIAEDEQVHLFERFFRSPTASRTERGLGLGLFVSKRIMDAHGGALTVQSQLGEGSTFTMRIPLVPPST